MGTGYHGGFGKTLGVRSQETMQLLKELESSGVKFSREDIIFILKDENDNISWLENGNSSVGLKHIIERHSRDFMKKHGVHSKDIANYLRHIFANGKVEYARQTYKNGRLGYEKLYSYKGKFFVLTGVGTNGFIITAYPIDEKIALKLKGRYGK